MDARVIGSVLARSRLPVLSGGIALSGLLSAAGVLDAQHACDTVPVAGTSIFRCIGGEGAPTIVLAAGAGLDSRTWRDLVPSLAALGTVVTFDRPGLGRSLPAPGPRTPSRIADEIRAVLEAAAVPGPFLLIGHSMGGVHMLRLAQSGTLPVVGVVLLDTPPPAFEVDRLALLTEAERAERRRLLEEGAVRAPPAVRHERDGAALEGLDPEAFPDIDAPLLVVVADRQDFGALGSPQAHRALWLDGSRAWLRRSSRSRLVVASGSGHMIHQEQPELVVQLVRELIRAAY